MRTVALAALAVMTAAAVTTGCSRPSEPVIERVDEAAETTSAVTPLERGKLRREVLDEAKRFIEAWKASDAEKLATLLPEDNVKLFTKPWGEFADQGLSVQHEHDVVTLDVTEFNQDATQATVSYAFKDTSHLVDAQGRKVRDLDPVDSSLTITLERDPDSDEWRILRMFMNAEGYR